MNEDFINRILELTNTERSNVGLPALTLNAMLSNAAQQHSDDMATNHFIDHNGSDGSSPFDRIKNVGYQFSTAGENIAAGQQTPEDAISSWINEVPPNDGHRKNILSPDFQEIGIGYSFNQDDKFQHYWTQDFGTQS